MFTVHWHDQEEQIESLQDVERLLDSIHERFRASGTPTLVVVQLEYGDSLSIGLGQEMSVLDYVKADNKPPYYASRGTNSEEGEISFLFGNQASEYSLSNAVPVDAARQALTYFCETGKLSDALSWEEV